MPHDASLIRKVVPALGGAKGQSQTAIINAVGAALNSTLTAYQITTPLRVAHFLAQNLPRGRRPVHDRGIRRRNGL